MHFVDLKALLKSGCCLEYTLVWERRKKGIHFIRFDHDAASAALGQPQSYYINSFALLQSLPNSIKEMEKECCVFKARFPS